MKTYDKFLGIVAKERNLPADGLRNGIADGRILSGRDALDNKLIRGLGQSRMPLVKAKKPATPPMREDREIWPPFSLGCFGCSQKWRDEDRSFALAAV